MIVQSNNNIKTKNQNIQSKDNSNNDTYLSIDNKPLRIVTHNVQGITDPTKQRQILNTLHLEDIKIMGLSETKLNPLASKYIFRNNQHYKAYFNNNSTSHTGSGV